MTRTPTRPQERAPIILGTRYGTKRQEAALDYAAARQAEELAKLPAKRLEQMRAGSAKVAEQLGSLSTEQLMQPGDTVLAAEDETVGKKPWRNADINPDGDPDDYESQQGLAIDSAQVSRDVRDDLVPTATGEFHQGDLKLESIGSQEIEVDPYYEAKKEQGLL